MEVRRMGGECAWDGEAGGGGGEVVEVEVRRSGGSVPGMVKQVPD